MEAQRARRNLLWGPARWVAGVWIAYGVVETVFAGIVPWAIHGRAQYVPQDVVFSAFVLALYGAIGTLLGLLMGSVRVLTTRGTPPRDRGDDEALWSAVGTSTVLVGCLANAVAQHAAAYVVWLLLGACALTIVHLIGVWRCGARTPGRWAASPWIVFALLLTAFYVGEERSGEWVGTSRVAGASICLLAVLSLGFFASRVRRAAGAGRGRRGRSLAIAVAGSLAAILVLGQQSAPAVAAAPSAPRHSSVRNILLITLDSVRADHLSVYGYARDTTPHLKEFVASGATLYMHAVAAGDMTLSSHASIFTGLTPRRHGAYCAPGSACRALSPDLPTLAGLLGQSGYDTAAVVANTAFLTHEFGMDSGFQHFEAVPHVQPATRTKNYYIRQSVAAAVRRAGVSDDNVRQVQPRGDHYRSCHSVGGAHGVRTSALLPVPQLHGRAQPLRPS